MSGDDHSAPVAAKTIPSLWKCYWVKMQSMMLLSGFMMLIGSLLHLMCPILLIYIIQFVEDRSIGSVALSNVTLPPVCIDGTIQYTIIIVTIVLFIDFGGLGK
jgi:hypothetical protein